MGGQTIDSSTLLTKFTYGGDATLDGKINIDDYVKIDSGIAGGFTGWSNGDFNYDGKVNIDDYITVIDANISSKRPAVRESGWRDCGRECRERPAWVSTPACPWKHPADRKGFDGLGAACLISPTWRTIPRGGCRRHRA